VLSAHPAVAAEGDHGVGHDLWHGEYLFEAHSTRHQDVLLQSCGLSPDRDPFGRRSHYGVKKDGRWIRVPPEKIVKVARLTAELTFARHRSQAPSGARTTCSSASSCLLRRSRADKSGD
jgi:hypothetical protein